MSKISTPTPLAVSRAMIIVTEQATIQETIVEWKADGRWDKLTAYFAKERM